MSPSQQAGPELTLTAIARILGLDPDTILYWALAGRLHVRQHGPRLIIVVDVACTFANPQPDQILILTKSSGVCQSQPSPSKSGPHSGPRSPRCES